MSGRFNQFVSVILACSVAAALMAHTAEQEEVIINFDNIFVPKGFDSNDAVEIIISGELPNTCYLRPRGEVKIINHRINIEMKATKIVDENVNCIGAVIPFMTSVALGQQMPEANYDITVNAGTSSERTSSILVERPNSNSINNFTYANVTNIQPLAETREIVISGYHPSSCMTLDRIEVFANTSNDTYSILPIIKQEKPVCDRMVKPFTHKLVLPQAQRAEELLHIRRIDGTALNFIVKEKRKSRH